MVPRSEICFCVLLSAGKFLGIWLTEASVSGIVQEAIGGAGECNLASNCICYFLVSDHMLILHFTQSFVLTIRVKDIMFWTLLGPMLQMRLIPWFRCFSIIHSRIWPLLECPRLLLFSVGRDLFLFFLDATLSFISYILSWPLVDCLSWYPRFGWMLYFALPHAAYIFCLRVNRLAA